ncbi:hypothetical protein [uncultured Dokdonia sp.]|uniref:hypothetical protein n=1 Tax=uncultured Dokdonia sp. TaxID=575653 RepID=UPI00260B5D9C|nr:hypothetical protein [uncultured Dokdonia sp.]
MFKFFKNILLRIVVYPFCAFLFIFSYQLVFGDNDYANPTQEAKAILHGVVGLLFAPVYPVVDSIILIKTFLKKKKIKTHSILFESYHFKA